jgi:hypothetical protein
LLATVSCARARKIDTADYFFLDTFGEHVAPRLEASVETTRFFAPHAATYALRESDGS